MKICIVNRGVKIPVITYGGTERVIWGLGKELHNLGHEITFLVPAGSYSDFARVIVLNQSKTLEEQIPDDIDIVHMNWEPLEELSKPFLVTMHGNPTPEDRLHINTVFISKNQAARHNSDVYVYNGLLWEDYSKPNLKGKRDSFHFLGKVSWKIKNAVGAMKIVRSMDAKLHIIGGTKWTFRNIKRTLPYLFSSKIEYHGFLDDKEKSKVMEKSKALIFPIIWHEPFGLAIIESMYAGCAVFGTANGSLPELIPAECGFTGLNTSEIITAIHNFDFNPHRCHEYAVKNFNARIMAENYLILYNKILDGECLHAKAPEYNYKLNQVPTFN